MRDAIVVAALFEAETELEALFESDDPADWIWGALHTRRFAPLVPDTSVISGDPSPFDLPTSGEGWPNGFPRPGDDENVDRCDWDYGDSYRCGGGSVQRLLVELDPDGIVSRNSTAGGQVMDPESSNFRDLLDLWLDYEWFEPRFHPAPVAAAPGAHLVLLP